MIARASTPDCHTVYNVTYPNSRAVDKDVSYGYLRCLARLGYEVHVAKTSTTEAHIIPAGKTMQ